jgi:hypothetical protein
MHPLNLSYVKDISLIGYDMLCRFYRANYDRNFASCQRHQDFKDITSWPNEAEQVGAQEMHVAGVRKPSIKCHGGKS